MTNNQLDHQTMLTLIEIYSEDQPNQESVNNAVETNENFRKWVEKNGKLSNN